MKTLRKTKNFQLNEGNGQARGLYNVSTTDEEASGLSLWFDDDTKKQLMRSRKKLFDKRCAELCGVPVPQKYSDGVLNTDEQQLAHSEIMEVASDIADALTQIECAKRKIRFLTKPKDGMTSYTNKAQDIFNDYYDAYMAEVYAVANTIKGKVTAKKLRTAMEKKSGATKAGGGKIEKVKDLLRGNKIDADIVSPNFVNDFAHKHGIKNLTSEQVVEISNTYENII